MVNEMRLPSPILYGVGSFAELGRQTRAYGVKALIVSDPVMEKLGRIDECRRLLKEAGLDVAVYSDVDREPTDRHVDEALKVCKAENCDVVVAIGGGSAIDAAKAVAVMRTNDGYIGDYMGGRRTFKHAPLPLIAVPTTAGTGSEVTKVTVIIDTKRDIKMMIADPALVPKVAIVDAELTLSCPKSVIAASGIDALCHAIEAYLSRKAHPVTDVWALKAIRLIHEHLPVMYSEKGDLNAHEQTALGAMLAGAAFSNASVTLIHGMSRPIGALFHVPHGMSNAMLLPAVLEFTQGYADARMAEIGRTLRPDLAGSTNQEAADFVLEEVKRLCKLMNIPNLRDWGIPRDAFERSLSKMATDALASGSPAHHPRQVNAEEIMDLYRICYEYSY